MRIFLIYLCLSAVLLVAEGITTVQAKGSFTPPSGKTILLVGQDRDTIEKYVKGTGSIPGGVMLYTSVQEMRGLEDEADYGSGPQDGNALLKAYPDSVIQIGLYMVNVLEDTLSGKYDRNLKILAQWLKKADRPVFLRIGYEFDLVENHYDPQQYKEVFRYIVNFLRKEKVTNAAYVWHSCSIEKPLAPLMDWYPGDDYVDWFGSSAFGTNQLRVISDFVDLARTHHKPFMFSESTPEGLYIHRSKINWFKHIFEFIDEKKVDAFCYIDSNWDVMPMYKGQSWGDSRVEIDPELKAIWLEEIKKDRYLKASPALFQLLGWTKKDQ